MDWCGTCHTIPCSGPILCAPHNWLINAVNFLKVWTTTLTFFPVNSPKELRELILQETRRKKKSIMIYEWYIWLSMILVLLNVSNLCIILDKFFIRFLVPLDVMFLIFSLCFFTKVHVSFFKIYFLWYIINKTMKYH